MTAAGGQSVSGNEPGQLVTFCSAGERRRPSGRPATRRWSRRPDPESRQKGPAGRTMADLLHTPLANRLLNLTFATTGFLATAPSSQSTLRPHLTRAMPFLRKCFGLLAHTLAPGASPLRVEIEVVCCSCCCLLLEGKKRVRQRGNQPVVVPQQLRQRPQQPRRPAADVPFPSVSLQVHPMLSRTTMSARQLAQQ